MSLYKHEWNVDDSRGTIVLVHGTGEHHGRYEHVARFLNTHGLTVKTGDLPGWGRSSGVKGHIDQFDDYVQAVAEWVEEAHERKQDAHHPVFLLGHSLGGLVVTRYTEAYAGRHGLSGLVLSSPCLTLKMPVPTWKKAVAETLNQVWPTLRIKSDIAPYHVSRDPQVQTAYIKDPFNYAKVSVRWFHELLHSMQTAWQEKQRVDVPVLVVQAGADYLIDAEKVQQFVQELPIADKEIVVFPNLYHEVLNEPEKEIVLETIGKWLDNRLYQ